MLAHHGQDPTPVVSQLVALNRKQLRELFQTQIKSEGELFSKTYSDLTTLLAAAKGQTLAVSVQVMTFFVQTRLQVEDGVSLQRLLAYWAVHWRIQAALLDKARVKEALSFEAVRTVQDFVCRYVLTGHPCEPQSRSNQLGAELVRPAPDSYTRVQSILQQLVEAVQDVKQPSIADEIKRADAIAVRLNTAATNIELDVPGKVVVEEHRWVGFESDRNSVTAETLLVTKCQNLLVVLDA